MTNKLPVGKRQTLEEVMDKCDNPDLWTPTQIICFISDYLDGSIGEELPEDNQINTLGYKLPNGDVVGEFPEDNQTDRAAKRENLVQDGGQHNSDLKVWLKAYPDYIETNKESTPTLSKEVLEAMEELKKESSNFNRKCKEIAGYSFDEDELAEILHQINGKAQNLLNALDSQFNHKTRDKEDSLSYGESKSFISTDWGKEGGDYTVETKYRKEGDKFIFEEINVIKPKEYIWKPVSELPTDGIYSILAKQKDNYYFGELNGHINYYPQIRLFFDNGLGEPEEKGSIDKCCTLTDFINQHNSLLDRVERLEQIIGDKK